MAKDDVAGLSRRAFLGVTATAVAASKARGGGGGSEAAELFDRLSEPQRREICLPAGHPLRSRASHRWAVVRPTVGDLGEAGRQSCRALLERACSAVGFARIDRAMREDSGGIEAYHLAFFGEPEGPGPFEWRLTGRHLTIGADARATEGGALAGPVFFGHEPIDGGPLGGVWESIREAGLAVFDPLTDRHRALVRSPSGANIGEMGEEIREPIQGLVDELLGTFREVDRRAVWGRIAEAGGIEAHRVVDGNRAGDAWRIDGPALSWWFLALPHVHSEVRIDWGTVRS